MASRTRLCTTHSDDLPSHACAPRAEVTCPITIASLDANATYAGLLHCLNTGYAAVCNVQCKNGFRSTSGDGKYTCEQDGQWAGKLVCEGACVCVHVCVCVCA